MSKTLIYTNDVTNFIPQTVKEFFEDGFPYFSVYLDDGQLKKISERILNKNIFNDMSREDGVKELDNAIHKCSHEKLEVIHSQVANALSHSNAFYERCQDFAMEDFTYSLADSGFLEKKENYLFLGSNIYRYADYAQRKISDADDIVNTLCHDHPHDSIVKIFHKQDKPYLEATVSSHDAKIEKMSRATIVPMKWIDKALKSDIGQDIQRIMLKYDDFQDAVRSAVPDLIKRKEANAAVEKFIISEVKYYPRLSFTDAAINQSLHELAKEIASFDFLKFKQNTHFQQDHYDSKTLRHIGADAFFDGNKANDYKHYNSGKYRLQQVPDDRLIDGIYTVLKSHDLIKIKQMVDGLFSKNRINTIQKLQTMNKELAK